jgi:hypothetical protein
MATSRTRNLRLFLSSGLSTEAKANLEIIDRLGDVYTVDNTDALRIRSKTDIHITPADKNIGGVGESDLFIGAANNRVGSFKIYANEFEMNGTLRIYDSAGGTKHLILNYKSNILPDNVIDTADRTLFIDLGTADRQLALAGDLKMLGPGSVSLTSAVGGSSVELPVEGLLVTRDGVEPLTNKLIDASDNTLSNIGNASIKAVMSKAEGISYSKLNLLGSVVDEDISASAAIAAAKLAVAPIVHLDASNVQDALLELQEDVDTRALDADLDAHTEASSSVHGVTGSVVGTGGAQTLSTKTLNNTSFTGTVTGLVKANVGLANVDNTSDATKWAATATLTNKTLSGLNNTFQHIPFSAIDSAEAIKNADIAPDAAIAYSKLNLADSIKDSDVSDNVADRIAGTKIAADFGGQSVSTEVSVKIGGTNQIELAPPSGGFEEEYTLKLPPAQAITENQVLAADGAGGLKWYAAPGSGTVTSVAMTVPSNLLSITGSPITTTGTLTVTLPNQSPNTIFAGPATGLSNEPGFRALVAEDLPSHNHVAADITDFQEAVEDAVDNVLIDSSSVSWTYDDTLGTLAAAVSLSSFNTGNLAEGSNLYYTASRVYTKDKAVIQGSSTVLVTANDGAETLTLSVIQSGISTDNITEGATKLFFTDERAQDAVANLIVNSNDISKTYDDEGNSFTLNLRPDAITTKTAVVPELTDYILVSDSSDAGALKKVLLSSVADLSGASYKETWSFDALNPTPGVKTITHNLASTDVIVQVFDVATGETVWLESMVRDTTNTVTLTAAQEPPVTGWRVLIKRI